MKYYGVFEVYYNPVRGEDLAHAKAKLVKNNMELTRNVFKNDRVRGRVYDERCGRVLDEAADEREKHSYSRRYSRGYSSIKTRFIVHECTEDGWFIPTKADIENAKKLGVIA